MKKRLGATVGLILMTAGLTFVISFVSINGYYSRVYGDTRAAIGKYLEVKRVIDANFIGDYDEETMKDYAAEAMVLSLGDRWSYYLPASEYGDYMDKINNSYVGIGVTIRAYFDDEGQQLGYEIVSVSDGGPAFKAGVLAGDILVAVEDTSVAGLSLEETKDIVRGEEGSPVLLGFLRNGEELEIRVIRGGVEIVAVEHEMLDEGLGYIQIKNFDTGVAVKTIDAIEELRAGGAESLLFDVRNDPGGLLNELLELLDYILPEGDIFISSNNSGSKTYTSGASRLEMPMAVLINSNSYSAAEFFAACLQEYGWADIVGEATSGKGYSQQSFRLSDGSAVVISTNEYFVPSGKSLADTGIEPDYPVEVSEEEFMALYYGTLEKSEDSQLQKAVELLLRQ